MGTIAKNIRQLREASGMTQDKLATAIGVLRGTLNSYEHGTMPPLEVLQKIADFYKVPVEDITYGDVEEGSMVREPDPKELFMVIKDQIRVKDEQISSLIEIIKNKDQAPNA